MEDQAPQNTPNPVEIAGNEHAPLVLIVDDDKGSRMRHEILLKRLNQADPTAVRIYSCASIPEALDVLRQTRAHVILLDKDLSTNKKDPHHSGIESIPLLLRAQPHLQILMITGSKDVQDSVRAIQLGALGYVTKESADTLIVSQIERALKLSEIAVQKYRMDLLRASAGTQVVMGGKSQVFKQILSQAQLLAESNRPVLILGESGTGKSEIAGHIHECRKTFLKESQGDLISLNMASLSSDIVERDLFGHEKGSYTDATESRPGFFEVAGNTGTLFLDEIGEASLELQAKLLTVIETGKFFRLGGTKAIHARPKLIFATNRDIEEMVREKRFREDLYMRIKSFVLHMPRLDERKEDIPEIIKALLPGICIDNLVPAGTIDFKDIPNDFIEYLMKSRIPGNIRGLIHVLDRLIVEAPRDPNGKRNLKNWRGIPSLYLDPADTVSEPRKAAHNAITFREIMHRPFDVLGPKFPGLTQFMKIVQEKILDEAQRKYSTNAKASEVLQIDPGYGSRLRRGVAANQPAAGIKGNKKRSSSHERKAKK